MFASIWAVFMSATIKARFWFVTEVQSPRLCLLLGPLTHFTRSAPRLDRKNLTIRCQTQTPYISKDSSCVSQVMPVLSPLLSFLCATALWSWNCSTPQLSLDIRSYFQHLPPSFTRRLPEWGFNIAPTCPLVTTPHRIPWNSGQPSSRTVTPPPPQSITDSSFKLSHSHFTPG